MKQSLNKKYAHDKIIHNDSHSFGKSSAQSQQLPDPPCQNSPTKSTTSSQYSTISTSKKRSKSSSAKKKSKYKNSLSNKDGNENHEEDRRYSAFTPSIEASSKDRRRATSVWGCRDEYSLTENGADNKSLSHLAIDEPDGHKKHRSTQNACHTSKSNKLLSFLQRGLRISRSVSRLDTLETNDSEETAIQSQYSDYYGYNSQSSGYSSIVLDNNNLDGLQIGCYGNNRHSYHGYHNQQPQNHQSKTPVPSSNYANLIPIPIRDTAVRMVSMTTDSSINDSVKVPMLFHRISSSNNGNTSKEGHYCTRTCVVSTRAKPLLLLNGQTQISAVHRSLVSSAYPHCLKIGACHPQSVSKHSGNSVMTDISNDTSSLSSQSRPISTSSSSSKLSLFDNSKNPSQNKITYLFSCPSTMERRHMLSVLSRIARPDLQSEQRNSISLSLWIQEAKNVAFKKRYFCEVQLDGQIHAKTTTKLNGDMLFWGEEIVLTDLTPIKTVTILLWKSPDEGGSRNKKRKSQMPSLICRVNINTDEILDPGPGDKWYHGSSPTDSDSLPSSSSLSSSSSSTVPMIRIKPRYSVLQVEPLSYYTPLLNYLLRPITSDANKDNKKTSSSNTSIDIVVLPLLLELEPILKVGHKEQLATPLIRVLHHQGKAHDLVAELILQEVAKSQDCNLILRGNTMASKTMEVYLKLVGEKYLHLVLGDFIERVSSGEDDCEVDPMRVSDGGMDKMAMRQRQESLQMYLEMLWAKVMSSSVYFPRDLRLLFCKLREALPGCPALLDRLLSATLFLRLICPAILAPSLFGLLPRPPDSPRGSRTLTLLAKTMQSLANFSYHNNVAGSSPNTTSTCFNSKEPYMSFMVPFLDSQLPSMRAFLLEISTPTPTKPQHDVMLTPTPHNPNPGNATTTSAIESLYWENLANPTPQDSIDLPLAFAQLKKQIQELLLNNIPNKRTEIPYLNELEALLTEMNKIQTEQVSSCQPTPCNTTRFSRLFSNPEQSSSRCSANTKKPHDTPGENVRRASLDIDITPVPSVNTSSRRRQTQQVVYYPPHSRNTTGTQGQGINKERVENEWQKMLKSMSSTSLSNMQDNEEYDGDESPPTLTRIVSPEHQPKPPPRTTSSGLYNPNSLNSNHSNGYQDNSLSSNTRQQQLTVTNCTTISSSGYHTLSRSHDSMSMGCSVNSHTINEPGTTDDECSTLGGSQQGLWSPPSQIKQSVKKCKQGSNHSNSNNHNHNNNLARKNSPEYSPTHQLPNQHRRRNSHHTNTTQTINNNQYHTLNNRHPQYNASTYHQQHNNNQHNNVNSTHQYPEYNDDNMNPSLLHTSTSLPSISDSFKHSNNQNSNSHHLNHQSDPSECDNYLITEPTNCYPHYNTIGYTKTRTTRNDVELKEIVAGECKWTSRKMQSSSSFTPVTIDTSPSVVPFQSGITINKSMSASVTDGGIDTIVRREMERIDLLKEIVPATNCETDKHQLPNNCPCQTQEKYAEVHKYLDEAEAVLWEVLGAYHNNRLRENDEKRLRQVLLTNKRLQQSILNKDHGNMSNDTYNDENNTRLIKLNETNQPVNNISSNTSNNLHKEHDTKSEGTIEIVEFL